MKCTNDVFNQSVIGQKDIDSLDKVYTRDARVLPPGGQMVEGRQAIKKFWLGAIEALGLTSAKLITVQAEQCGEGVLEIGRVELAFENAPGSTAKYVVFWKQEQGVWRWDVDIWNMNS